MVIVLKCYFTPDRQNLSTWVGGFSAQRTELQKYLDAKRWIKDKNHGFFSKTDGYIAQLNEISSGFRIAFIKYGGESTTGALSSAISDLFGCCQSWLFCYQQDHKLSGFGSGSVVCFLP